MTYDLKLNSGEEISIRITQDRESGDFIAHYPAFNISTEGNTLSEAKTQIIEAIELYLKEITNR